MVLTGSGRPSRLPDPKLRLERDEFRLGIAGVYEAICAFGLTDNFEGLADGTEMFFCDLGNFSSTVSIAVPEFVALQCSDGAPHGVLPGDLL